MLGWVIDLPFFATSPSSPFLWNEETISVFPSALQEFTVRIAISDCLNLLRWSPRVCIRFPTPHWISFALIIIIIIDIDDDYMQPRELICPMRFNSKYLQAKSPVWGNNNFTIVFHLPSAQLQLVSIPALPAFCFSYFIIPIQNATQHHHHRAMQHGEVPQHQQQLSETREEKKAAK